MNKEDFFQLGKITRLHGYKGAVTLFLDADDPSAYRSMDGIFLDINGELIPYFLRRFDLKGNKAVVEFEGVESEEEAKLLVNKDAFLPMQFLPKLKGKQFYFHEVMGFTLVDKTAGEFGEILDITDHPTNPLFITKINGKDALIPMHDDVLEEVDRKNKRIVLDLPEGMLDLFE